MGSSLFKEFFAMLYTSNNQSYELDTMLIDLNGTLCVWWVIDSWVPPLLAKLKSMWWKLLLLTGNQRGNADTFAQYGLDIIVAKNAQEKASYVATLDTEKCVAIGNARIDIGMFQQAKISIATLQDEGIHANVLSHVDIIVPSMRAALSLFVDKDRFAATMKM